MDYYIEKSIDSYNIESIDLLKKGNVYSLFSINAFTILYLRMYLLYIFLLFFS